MAGVSGLAEVLQARFVIVGGGIAGASLAFELASQGSVILLEREDGFGVHSTGRSAAMYLANYGNEFIRRLSAASRAFLDDPPVGFSATPLLKTTGAITIAGPGQLDALAREAAGGSYFPMEAEKAIARVPVLRREAVAAALWDPTAAAIDVDALLQGFLRGARARGVLVVSGAELQQGQRTASGWELSGPGFSVLAETVINAAGAWADEVARRCGLEPIGIAPLRRTAVTVPAPAGVAVNDWPLVIDVGETVYFKPDAGRLLISPADETPVAAQDVQPDEMDVAIAVARFEEIADYPVRRVEHRWAGLRCFAPDRTPVVGPDPAAPSFHWLAGQGGYGIQTSPALARLAAAMVAGRSDVAQDIEVPPEVLSPVRLLRHDAD